MWGVEDHQYPIKKSMSSIRSKIKKSNYYDIPFKNNYFDFVIGFSSIYKYNFMDVVRTLKEINRVSKKSFCNIGEPIAMKRKKII